MGASPPPPSSSEEHKHNITMGYPSMDPYSHANYMYPHQQPAPSSAGVVYPVPCGPQGYAPHPYTPNSSYPFPKGNHNPSNYLSHTTSQNAYTGQPYNYLSHTASQNTYTVQPYNDFYYPQQHYKHLAPTETSNSSSFGRVMLLLMFAFVASMSIMTLITWFLFGTYIPEFEIVSIKVSNFSVTEAGLNGTWAIATKVSNPNKDLGIRFDNVYSSMMYKEEMLGVSAVNPFNVLQMQTIDINITIPAVPAAGGYKVGTLAMLKHDFNNGMVVFSLRLAMTVNFMTQNMVYRHESVGALCENMQVMFSMETGEGMMAPGLQSICLIRLNEGLKGS